MAEQRDVVEVLTHDHREVEQMFDQYHQLPTTGSDDQRRALVDQMIIELVRHSVAEEEYLYPAVKESVAGGAQLAEREIGEHAEAERTMNTLDKLRAGDPSFGDHVAALMGQVRAHIAEEEGDLFPKLQQAVGRPEMVKLGELVEHAKTLAPTRPHPAAPDRPPFDKLAAPATGLADKVRDFLTGRGKSS